MPRVGQIEPMSRPAMQKNACSSGLNVGGPCNSIFVPSIVPPANVSFTTPSWVIAPSAPALSLKTLAIRIA